MAEARGTRTLEEMLEGKNAGSMPAAETGGARTLEATLFSWLVAEGVLNVVAWDGVRIIAPGERGERRSSL